MNFKAIKEDNNLSFSWSNPVNDENFLGVKIVRNQYNYPASPMDGMIICECCSGESHSDSVEPGKKYFYAAFSINKDQYCSRSSTKLFSGEWTRQRGSSYGDISNSIAIDIEGNIYITGYTSGNLDGNTNQGGYDIFLMKFNPEGYWQWTRQIGTASSDRARSIAVSPSGNIWITGYTGGVLEDKPNSGGSDIFVMCF